jgi:pimeloyl-ACP methyl ester carboxylesterase
VSVSTETSQSVKPRLVFIHGATGPKKLSTWLSPLNNALAELGVSGWEPDEVASVDYMPMLRDGTIGAKLPGSSRPERVTRERDADFDQNRRELSARLAPHTRSKKPWGGRIPTPVSKSAAMVARRAMFERRAQLYLRRRNSVTTLVRDEAGAGELIVIGYSLGSVVAADLLRSLRSDQHLRLLVTIGSPLGQRDLWKKTIRGCEPFPKDRLDAWVNIYNTSDLVTSWSGVEPRLPDVIDVPIGRFGKKSPHRELLAPHKGSKMQIKRLQEQREWGMAQHKVRGYVRHRAFAEALAWALEDTATPEETQ